jgi:carnitine 3-dehydrogenase
MQTFNSYGCRLSIMHNEIERIACVGAGTIGRSWATLFAGKGCEVVLQDVDKNALEAARRIISSNYRALVNYKLVSHVDAESAIDRIEYATSLPDAVKSADFVQESVPEFLSLKQQIFSKISLLVRPNVIIASSSGGFPMSKIQVRARIPGRCVVIHPCQLPVHLTRLVEIVPGRLTEARTVKVASSLMREVGKQPLVMKREVQDYIINRLQFTLFREAVDMVGKGIVSAEEIDAALCEFAKASFCIGLGPFLQAHIHGGPHGAGGIEACMDYYAKILPDTWRSLAKWTQIPKSVKLGAERSVRNLVRRRGLNDKELVRWRDRGMLELARIVWA